MNATPAWSRHAICWHLYPLGALGCPQLAPEGNPQDPSSPAGQERAQHRFRHLEGWLDYVLELGCNVIILGPIFRSMSHGYDTVDYFDIDPRLGDESDVLSFIEQAHRRGIKVIADGVFNHVGKDFPLFAELPVTGPHSTAANMFHLTWPGGVDNWTEGLAPDYQRFEGQDWLPELNHDSEDVSALVLEVMTYWCERGIDGWRLDAAYAVNPHFWSTVLPQVRQRFPEVFIFGEVIHGDYPAIVHESGMDSVTEYELWKSIWSSLASGNFFELEWTLRRHEEFCHAFVPLTFVGNHDTTRIASQCIDTALLPLAITCLLTLPGLPCVYYGDEQGYRGVKEDRIGGDNDIRPVLPDSPADFSPLGQPILRQHQELIALRRRTPWLYDAVVHTEHVTNEQVVYTLSPRTNGDQMADDARQAAERGQVVTVVLNSQGAKHGGPSLPPEQELQPASSPSPIALDVPGQFMLASSPGVQHQPHSDGNGSRLVMPSCSWAILASVR
ncbi:alpha-amylase family protein [Actinomyces vulturis]|uniref:alpha-amylase family protein n=1 Tax=Actinomyces vulturis TaxID=1857645 RepID=UPI000833A4CB|nr:alpha-amylase family protein [Actinomyces vulturis]